MKDRFDRELTYLRLSVVDRCNLRCLYCMPKDGAKFAPWKDLLSDNEIVSLVRAFAGLGLKKVRLTGGEPLVRPNFAELVAALKAIPGIEELVMTTNGIFLKREARRLKAAGLGRVNVSLDTLRRDCFTQIARMDRLREVLEGIDEALAAGLTPLKINTVLMKGVNDGEILDLVRFAVARKIEVRFIEVMPTDGSLDLDPKEVFFSTEEAKTLIETEFSLTLAEAYVSSPACVYSVDGTSARVGFVSPLSCFFCVRCNRLRLKADGKLKTCLHGKDDLDLRAMLRSGASEQELQHAIRGVVWDRPEQHFLNDPTVPHNDFQMSHVGG